MQKKISTSVDILCKNLPQEFGTYLTYCRNLKFEEKPDYAYLKKLFKDLFVRSNFTKDYVYDWNIVAQNKEKEKQQLQENQKGSQSNIATTQT